MSHSETTELTLVIEQTGQTFSLDQKQITIGRKADNNIVLTDDKAVSRQHAIIFEEAGHYIIQDAGSANGTFVNDQRITELHPLSDGDILRIGRTHLTVQLPPQQKEEPPQPTLPLDAEMTVVGAMPPSQEDTLVRKPPSKRAETKTEVIPIQQPSSPPPDEPPTHRNQFVIQKSAEFEGNFDIFDPESGQLLLKCVQARDLMKSVLKMDSFDCWMKTPADKPVIRITKGRSMLGTKSITFKDEHDQLMGKLEQQGEPPTDSFEVFDAIESLMFRVEHDDDNLRFSASGIECALVSPKPAGSFAALPGDTKQHLLEISEAVPKHSFIRTVILATAVAILLITSA